ncbi:hypothetical protein J5X84_41205 [Streptosporangiaceae bacterium NEAU-GS5]|nr:hypothetical protein [Streptosporangiaceae bacterium NEAU-GS5]
MMKTIELGMFWLESLAAHLWSVVRFDGQAFVGSNPWWGPAQMDNATTCDFPVKPS